jgi:hypothetical protein
LGRIENQEDEFLGATGLYYIAYILEIRTHLAMMTMLVEWWHFETSSFYLPIDEVMITLEDI